LDEFFHLTRAELNPAFPPAMRLPLAESTKILPPARQQRRWRGTYGISAGRGKHIYDPAGRGDGHAFASGGEIYSKAW
jgi:hypothetical protein